MKAFWFAIITAVIWGAVPIMEKIALGKGMNPMLGVVIRSLGIAIGALVLWAVLAKNPDYAKNVTWSSALLLVVSAALAAIVGQIFYYTALQQGDVSKIIPVAGSFPLVSFILGTLLLGEAVTIPKLVGVLCVIAGVILLK